MLEVLAEAYADEVEQAKKEVFEWVAEQTGTTPEQVEKAWRGVMITYQGAKMLGGPSQKLAQTLLKSDAGKKVTGFLRNLKPTRTRVPAKTQPRQIGFTDPQGVAHTQHLKPGKMEVLPGNDSKKVRVQTERRPGVQKGSQPSKTSTSGASEKTLKDSSNGSSPTQNSVKKYEVGTYDDLKKRSQTGDGLDIHHAVQKHPAEQVIPGYNQKRGPSIALPKREHAKIKDIKGEYKGTSRDLLAKNVKDLREHTKAENKILRELIDLNKKMYPEEFILKGKK
jgi:hypothetical protein